RRPRPARRHDRQPDLALPRQAPRRVRGKKPALYPVEWTGDVMSGYDHDQLAQLIGMLPPAPEAWVRAAQELPEARRGLDNLVARAEADAAFRAAVLAELEQALE